ncbi:hypothetical protein F2P81_026117 [Scophthalmus maximus]|uniref:Sortilin N-terminal domain-containing protein n=1 Tax=Scophthalmus maximus TaxID=52904 RepID=A0A6A4RQG9_SCOMX|nr:hypothetical protein F2P81_026117 [Scophthalmus maximus]
MLERCSVGVVRTDVHTGNRRLQVRLSVLSLVGSLQVFDEEYAVLYLDQGGALVAIRHTPLPIRHLWLSFDEGRQWSKYSFTNTPLFVDGVLGEPGEETLIMT